MPDNWSFVAAAYGLAAIVFLAYWRWLARREHDLRALRATRRPQTSDSPTGSHDAR